MPGDLIEVDWASGRRLPRQRRDDLPAAAPRARRGRRAARRAARARRGTWRRRTATRSTGALAKLSKATGDAGRRGGRRGRRPRRRRRGPGARRRCRQALAGTPPAAPALPGPAATRRPSARSTRCGWSAWPGAGTWRAGATAPRACGCSGSDGCWLPTCSTRTGRHPRRPAAATSTTGCSRRPRPTPSSRWTSGPARSGWSTTTGQSTAEELDDGRVRAKLRIADTGLAAGSWCCGPEAAWWWSHRQRWSPKWPKMPMLALARYS